MTRIRLAVIVAFPLVLSARLRDATRRAVQDPEFRSAMDKVETPIGRVEPM